MSAEWKWRACSSFSLGLSPCRRTVVPGLNAVMGVTMIEVVVRRLLHVMSHRIHEAVWK